MLALWTSRKHLDLIWRFLPSLPPLLLAAAAGICSQSFVALAATDVRRTVVRKLHRTIIAYSAPAVSTRCRSGLGTPGADYFAKTHLRAAAEQVICGCWGQLSPETSLAARVKIE